MGAILEQLGLDQTFFVQLAVFALVFFVLTPLYFKPFLCLFAIRHKRTVDDQEAAERLMAQAQAKLQDYYKKLQEEKTAAKKVYDLALAEAKKEESLILSKAREEAKKLTQEAADSIASQRESLRRQLEFDVESLANAISERLISKKFEKKG